jgi:hypothetical protein
MSVVCHKRTFERVRLLAVRSWPCRGYRWSLSPLDREVLDRAFDEAWAAVHAKANALIESSSDEELEALLRRELTEIASFNGLDEQIVQKILSYSGLDV